MIEDLIRYLLEDLMLYAGVIAVVTLVFLVISKRLSKIEQYAMIGVWLDTLIADKLEIDWETKWTDLMERKEEPIPQVM